MKKGRSSLEARSTARLLDFWQHRPEFGDPVGCVTTTYTFDASFFEEHCLSRFLAMDSDVTDDARTYLLEREEKLSQVFAAVLVDQSHVPLARSLRWHALPVRVAPGILHAKLSLLVWQRRIRLLIGSANMTEPGYRQNFENLAALDFDADGGVPLSLLRDALDFLEDIRRLAPGVEATQGPQPALRRFLAGVGKQVQAWNDTPWPRGGPSATLVVTGRTSAGLPRPHLFLQLGELWKSRNFPPANEAWVMSPFFDDADGATQTVAELERILVQRGDRDIHYIATGRVHADDTLEVDLPECLRTGSREAIDHRIHRITPDPEEANRPLHAKSIWLQRDRHAIHCIGSGNFTAPGTGWRPSGPMNVEVNLAYILPDLGDDLARACERAYPPCQEVYPKDDDVCFLQPRERTADGEAHALLPPGFGSALFVPGGRNGKLVLEIAAAVPSGFRVGADDGTALIDEARWRAFGTPHTVEVPWEQARPASHLFVSWPGDDGDRTAIWTVNVSDSSSLPPPEELRKLGLEDLLEILASARPAHEILSRILARTVTRAAKAAASGPEVDPHKKIDTRHFLLRRMKRVSAALEQLRTRLGKPAYSIEAFSWRINGPLGPLALAERIVAEEPEAASFFLAEIADTLHSTGLQVLGDLGSDEARAVVAEALARLAALARGHKAPENLTAYVDRVFVEIGS